MRIFNSIQPNSRQMWPLMVVLIASLGGCVTTSTDTGSPIKRPGTTYPVPQEQPSPEVIKDTPKIYVPNEEVPQVVARGAEAIDSLAIEAQQLYATRDYQSAIASAERGLRINRRSPDLYLVLAQSYLQLGQPERARSFVQQGLRYAAPGTDVYQALQRTNDAVGF